MRQPKVSTSHVLRDCAAATNKLESKALDSDNGLSLEDMNMSSYIISYELNLGEKQHYADLLLALERFEDRCHALDTVWFVSTPWSAAELYSYLRRYLDPADGLLVEKLPVGQAWSGWMRADVREWLTDHLGLA